jgi:hypothetical protein
MKSRSDWDRHEHRRLTANNEGRKRDSEDTFVYFPLSPDFRFIYICLLSTNLLALGYLCVLEKRFILLRLWDLTLKGTGINLKMFNDFIRTAQ